MRKPAQRGQTITKRKPVEKNKTRQEVGKAEEPQPPAGDKRPNESLRRK
jgi:hypothetical protein